MIQGIVFKGKMVSGMKSILPGDVDLIPLTVHLGSSLMPEGSVIYLLMISEMLARGTLNLIAAVVLGKRVINSFPTGCICNQCCF